jgi:hypothetical protein
MRRSAAVAVAALVAGVVLGAAIPSGAGNGDTLVLGTKNHASRVTKLIGKNGLEIRSSKNIPLRLYSQPGVAPLMVNQTVAVDNLNADLVDGRHSYQLWTGVYKDSNDNLPDAANWTSTQGILAPLGGATLVMSGGVGWHNDTGAYYEGGCRFKVDGTAVSGSFRADGIGDNESATCTSEIATQVTAGSHTVTFTTFSMGTAGVKLNEGSWYVLVLPN